MRTAEDRTAEDRTAEDRTAEDRAAPLPPQPSMLWGDPARLRQIVLNLLSNAIKFTPPGGLVTVSLEDCGDAVEIAVADTGQGISADFLPFVFDRFRQADATTTRSHGGLGLGLAIVRQLAELHGGAVRAESDGPGLGARFTIRLPIAPSASAGPAPDRNAEPAPEPPRSLQHLDGVTVLVVDDETDSRLMVRQVLEQCGARVIEAASAAEALEQVRHHRPSVLLSDIAMPGEDGYSLIRRLRALPADAGGAIPAAAMSAHAGTTDRRTALESGFQLHIAKPFDADAIARTVAALAAAVPPPRAK